MIRRFLHITAPPRTGWLTVAAWMACAFFLSSLSPNQIPETGLNLVNIDKLAHFLLYFGGGIILARALDTTFVWRRRRIFLVASILLGLYGLSDEYHQTFVAGRSGGDPGDWIADLAGTVVGTLTYLNPIRNVEEKTSQSSS